MKFIETDQTQYTVVDGGGLSKRIGVPEQDYTRALCDKSIDFFIFNGRIKVIKQSLDKWLSARKLSQVGGQD